MSPALFQPEPTVAEGAAVKVGAESVFSDPVGVYVGRSPIWVPEKEGEIVAGGNGCEAAAVGSRVPAPAYENCFN